MVFTDNNIWIKEDDPDERRIFKASELEGLLDLADRSIETLCQEYEGLLVFPHSITETQDFIGESPIFKTSYNHKDDTFKITTGNIMGFLGVNGIRMKIKSRFDKNNSDYLLHYMLQKVYSFNLFDLSYSNEAEGIFDLLMFVFPHFLQRAMNQGLYREYQRYSYNDANIKGSIDVSRHIQKNIPFLGKIAYNTKVYSHDNHVTELIRHTIEFMKTRRLGDSVLKMNRSTIENVQIICSITSSYDRGKRQLIMQKNLRPASHPYYSDYLPLQKLCLQVLRMDEIKYGNGDNKVTGLLFDGAWLWEEYINKLLEPLHFIHPQNKKKEGAIYLFEDYDKTENLIRFSGERYPDFYKDDVVLDAKYKRLGGYTEVDKVDRNDIHQIISYMHKLKARRGGYICPLEKEQPFVPSSHLAGYGGELSILGIEINHDVSSFKDFCNEMQLAETKFLQQITKFSYSGKTIFY